MRLKPESEVTLADMSKMLGRLDAEFNDCWKGRVTPEQLAQRVETMTEKLVDGARDIARYERSR